MRPSGQTSESAWPIRVEPFDDEITSSWLVRAARIYGESAADFVRLVWGDLQVWNRDTDTALSVAALSALGQRLQVSAQRSANTSLGPLLPCLGNENVAWIPGLLRAGVFHRTRRRHGQQYCPECLADDGSPYFRREWRLAFTLVCQRHGCLLRDACPRCDEAVVPHRAANLRLDHCHICGAGLAGKGEPASPYQISAQALLLQAWQRGTAPAGSIDVAFPDWLRGLRILYHALHRPELAAQLSCPNGIGAGTWARRTAPLELARLSERAALLPTCVWLASGWPERMVLAGQAAELRATGILDPKRAVAPPWLRQAVMANFPYVSRGRKRTKRGSAVSRRALREVRGSLDLGQLVANRLDALDAPPRTLH